eukprot:scaffold1095_cov328-Pavlova_lutheri.AAC.2
MCGFGSSNFQGKRYFVLFMCRSRGVQRLSALAHVRARGFRSHGSCDHGIARLRNRDETGWRENRIPGNHHPPRVVIPNRKGESGVVKVGEPLFAEFRHPSVTPLATQPDLPSKG